MYVEVKDMLGQVLTHMVMQIVSVQYRYMWTHGHAWTCARHLHAHCTHTERAGKKKHH